MVRPHLLMRIVVGRNHTKTSCPAEKTMFARTVTSCRCNDVGSSLGGGTGRGWTGGAVVSWGQAYIQAAIPWRTTSALPHEWPADKAPFKIVQRRSSYRAVHVFPGVS